MKRAFGLCLILSALAGCGSSGLSVTTEPGPSPFISKVYLTRVPNFQAVTAVQYTIAPKPGSLSKPVHVEYSIAALQARGYVSDAADATLVVPVFGLYAGYENQVSIEVVRGSGSPLQLEVDIPTADYVDPTNIYSQLNILTPRPADSSVDVNFIYIKSSIGSPIIIDTDGNIRWAAPGVPNSMASAFEGDSFIIGSLKGPLVYRMGLDGSVAQINLPAGTPYTDFQHDIIQGKQGLLAAPDLVAGGVEHLESNVIEMTVGTNAVTILKSWSLGAIIANYMNSQGDDAGAFVREGVDWFHENSALYDPANDSLLVSSRENFIIDIDYSTGAINWIFGDPTKYWYTFPSLRAKAITQPAGGLYPIGQHGLSITPDGNLILFNDGKGSLNEPAGQPAGETRTYSAVSAYSIDPTTLTATNLWNFDAGQTIFSPYCGSAYEQGDQSVLADYAVADGAQHALIVALDANHNVIFTFEYPNNPEGAPPGGAQCNTSWIARPFALDKLQITQ